MTVTNPNTFVPFLFIVLLWLVGLAVSAVLVILIIKALLKYIRSKPVREEKQITRVNLAQALREHRTENHMTQEFVAEAIGVSRQAVSKWENGTSDPSTSNLLALAKLYQVSPTELLSAAESNTPNNK